MFKIKVATNPAHVMSNSITGFIAKPFTAVLLQHLSHTKHAASSVASEINAIIIRQFRAVAAATVRSFILA